jgi:hypothetical protein
VLTTTEHFITIQQATIFFYNTISRRRNPLCSSWWKEGYNESVDNYGTLHHHSTSNDYYIHDEGKWYGQLKKAALDNIRKHANNFTSFNMNIDTMQISAQQIFLSIENSRD